jgi:serine/threonine protein kinase
VVTRTIGAFEIVTEQPIAGGGVDATARRASSGEEVRLWIGAPGRARGAGDLSPDEMVRRLAKVVQTGLPRVVEGFVHGETAVLVVQAYKGITLEERLEQGTMPVVDALDVAKAIGAALAKAHAQGVVHGCVDERAVFLHEDGRALLLHLGMGPFLDARPARAPEDVEGPPSETGDVFGLSRILVRLVTGEDPGRGIASSGVREFTSLSPDLPEGLRRLLARAVRFERSERIRRAEELAGDLRVLRASWDSIAKPPERPLPFPPLGRFLVLAALVVLAAFGVWLARGCTARAGFPG